MDRKIWGDIVCALNVPDSEVNDWIEMNKKPSYIELEGKKEFIGYDYPNIFVFKDRSAYNKFAQSINMIRYTRWGIALRDIEYALSSYKDDIRIIKHSENGLVPEFRNSVCAFLDTVVANETSNAYLNNEVVIEIVSNIVVRNGGFKEVFYTI